MVKVYGNFSEAVDTELIDPLVKAHASPKDFDLDGLANIVVKWSEKDKGYIVDKTKFWESLDDFTVN